MLEQTPPPREVVRTGYETRDLSVSGVVSVAVVLVLSGIVLLIALWQWSLFEVPEQKEGATPPTAMPREPPVGDRVKAVPPPHLEGNASQSQRPEDLRADRQPALNGFEWVEKGKVARIPISAAMDAVVEAERAKPAKKDEKHGGKK